MSYFKFTSAAALEAWADMERQEQELKAQSEAFATLFGGKPIFQKTACDTRFYGVLFFGSAYGNEELWTKGTSKNGGARQPRVKVPGSLKLESEALWQLWNEKRPTMTADREAFYQSIGLDWGNLLFGGFEMFLLDGAIYVQTGATPKPEAGGEEILGSVYHNAKAAATAAKAGQ